MAVYVAAICIANLTVAAFGPAVTPVNAFLLIGLDLALRDRLHDLWAGNRLWARRLGMIALAGLLSWAVNPAAGRVALASLAAFVVAGGVDAAVYHALRSRPFLQRSHASNERLAAQQFISQQRGWRTGRQPAVPYPRLRHASARDHRAAIRGEARRGRHLGLADRTLAEPERQGQVTLNAPRSSPGLKPVAASTG